MSRANRKRNRRRIVPKKAVATPLLDNRLKVLFIASKLPSNIGQRMQQYLPGYGEVEFTIDEDVALSKEGVVQAALTIGKHRMTVIGFSTPASEKHCKMALDCANWPREDKAMMRAHSHHMQVNYEGGCQDPTEQFLAIYKLAACLIEDGLLGVMDAASWNCVPAHAIKQLMMPEVMQDCLKVLPLPLWTGFAKIFVNSDELWFCSKGFHRWGVMDFAWFGTMKEASEVYELFHGLFHYAHNNQAKLKAGDTAQFGDNLILRFVKLPEYHEYLEGPIGTLVIERLDPTNFH